MAKAKGRVRFNVGGKVFETTSTTLANAGRQSMLGALLDDEWNVAADAPAEYFIDRNPRCFAVLLDLLRTGHLYIPSNLPDKLLFQEAAYYGLLDHVRAAKWGSFDGNRLALAASVAGRAPGDGTAIRASPDGGCCVAHGSMVHLYDWTLEQRPPVTFNYQRVNDACYLDASAIAVAVTERPCRGDGGLAVFSVASGELRDKFEVSHGGERKSFTAGALAFDPAGDRIFASCRGRSSEYGVGIWDRETGKQVDFFYESPGWSLGDADKLQWLQDNCYISFLDPRSKSMVWSWSDHGAANDEKISVLDAIAMESTSSVCVVNQYDDLGFMDWRATGGGGGGPRWSSRSRTVKRRSPEEMCYPKLAAQGGQLFSSMNDSISVFCGPEWVLTARLGSRSGGSIFDFSIGGDRLFALHSDENVFDVWETPSYPVL